MVTYTSDSAFDWILGIIQKVSLFQEGTNYLVILGIVLIGAILISPRDLSNIKILALPLMIGTMVSGLHVPLIFLIVGGILFVMETLTTKTIGSAIKAIEQTIGEVGSIPEKIRIGKLDRFEKEQATRSREATKRKVEFNREAYSEKAKLKALTD